MKKRLTPILLAFTTVASSLPGGVLAKEQPVKVGGDEGIMPLFAGYGEASQSYEPWIHGFRYVDLLHYSPETDPYAEEMRATVPLQNRNETYTATQANPWLGDQAQLYVMSASNYRNTGAEIWNGNASYDDFTYAPFMYWQYANITGTGGRPTAGMHRDIETGYGVEYGPVCIPMAAATNVAHRNGVMSLGEFFIDASWRGGQFIEEFIYKDEDGNYPYAQKMIEIMEYYGFDGYFINLEASIDAGYVDTFREILAWMRDQGAYIQWYDSTLDDGRTSYQNAFNDYNKNWVINDKQGQVSDGIFLNYGYGNWSGDMTTDNVELRKGVLKAAHEKAVELGLDPYEAVFMGVEGDLWRLSADFDSGDLLQWGSGNFNSGFPKAVDENGQPYTSFAVWASDFYQKDYHDGHQFDVGYQWEAEERARMYYNSRTENAGDYSAVERPDINFDLASNLQAHLQQPVFKGFSKYVVEKSVINGRVFASDFNNGHGMQYWSEGQVSRNMQWTNYGLQDILPTWQWWVESDDGIPAPASLRAKNLAGILNRFPVSGNVSGGDVSDNDVPADDMSEGDVSDNGVSGSDVSDSDVSGGELGSGAMMGKKTNDGIALFSARGAEELLELDWDYGPEFYRLNNKTGERMGFPYKQIGAYNGGSSLVIYGDLTGGQVVNLYKTELEVAEGSTISLTYNKPYDDEDTCMYAVLSLKKGEDVEQVYLPIKGSGLQTEGWETVTLDLSMYAGETIASVGVGFVPLSGTVSGYQVNLGRLVITDNGDYSPASPAGLHIAHRFDATGEIQVAWEEAEFGEVQNYHVYAVYADGSERFVGGGFGSSYYIMNLENEADVTALRVYAVGRDGSRSEPAQVALASSEQRITNVLASNVDGRLNITWNDPANIYKGDTVEVALEWQGTDRENPAPLVVDAGTGKASFDIPLEDGSSYLLTFTVTRLGETQEPVNYFNMINDSYSAPYDGEARKMPTASGNYYLLTTPSADDWRAMLVETSTGTKRLTRFSEVTNSWGAFAGEFAKYIPIAQSGSDSLTIRVEDIDFNVSEPVTILFQDGELATGNSVFGDDLFPDETLREAVRKQVGETYDALNGFKGTLDLSGTDVADLTGLNYLGSMTGLNLENCTNLVYADFTQYPRMTVNVAGCSSLESLFMPGTQQTSLDIRGTNKLKEFDISGSQISVLEADDASAYTSAINWMWDNARMDLSEGTPEGKLKAGMEEFFASGNVNPDFSAKEEVLYQSGEIPYTSFEQYQLLFELWTPGKITSVTYTNTFHGYFDNNPIYFDLMGGYIYTTFEEDHESVQMPWPDVTSFEQPGYESVMVTLNEVPARWFYMVATVNQHDFYENIYTKNWIITGYPYLEEGVFTYSGQKPVMDLAFEADSMVVEEDGTEYQLLDLLKRSYEARVGRSISSEEFGAMTNRGTIAADLIGQNWADQQYLAGYITSLEDVRVVITGDDEAAYVHSTRPSLGAISSEPLKVDGTKAVAKAQVSEKESAAKLFDGKNDTKWCDNANEQSWIGFELDEPAVVGEWYVLHAGKEGSNFITREYSLQVLKSRFEDGYLAGNEEQKKAYLADDSKWEVLDKVSNNTVNSLTRQIAMSNLKTGRVYRLKVDQPEQIAEGGGKAIRIYELQMYAYEGDLKGVESNGYFKADKAGAYYVEYLRPGNVEDNVLARTTVIVQGEGPADRPICTLSFETNGGSAIESVSRSFGETVDLSGFVPSRDGYDFTGWYSDPELTEKVTEMVLNGNKTVYAGWKESPVVPTEKPAEPTETPAEPTEKPAEPTEKPAEPTEKPAEPTEKPAEPDSGNDGSSSEPEKKLATLVVRMVDAAGKPAAGLLVELHSTPKTARTDRNGFAVFRDVEEGKHTLYVKDEKGNVLASQTIEIVYGDNTSLQGGQLVVKPGEVCTLHIKFDGQGLTFVSQQDGDVYHVVSPKTSDQAQLLLWIVLAIVSGGAFGGIWYYGRKKKS